MEFMRTLEDVQRDYNNGVYKNKLKYPNKSKFKEDTIFDEDKSVRWNREEAIRQNEKIDQEKKEYQKETNRLENQLQDDAIKALMESYKFNIDQASKIWHYAYSEKHSYMSDVFIYADELANFIEEFNKIK